MMPSDHPGPTVHEGLRWPLPTNSLVVVFGHPEEAEGFLTALEANHIDAMVETATGAIGAFEIHKAFHHQGIFNRLISHLNGEDDFADLLEDEVEHGGEVVLVSARPEHHREVMELLPAFHPELIEAKGRWVRHETITNFTPPSA